MANHVFGCFDRAAEVEIKQRNLPHWFQPGVAIFITYRTADSLPLDVLLRWRRELEAWLATRGLPTDLAGSTVRQRLPHHEDLLRQLDSTTAREFKRLSDRAFHRSLDECHGACLLRQPPLAQIVGDAIRYYDGKKYDLDRFVVMPNHVHAIVQFRVGFDLKTVSQSWMRYTARQINGVTGDTGSFWQPEPFDHLIRHLEQLEYLRRYVAENPEKAHLRPGEFLYWQRA